MTDLAANTEARRPAAHPASPRRSRGPGSWIVLAALIALLVIFLFPFILAAANAIKTPECPRAFH